MKWGYAPMRVLGESGLSSPVSGSFGWFMTGCVVMVFGMIVCIQLFLSRALTFYSMESQSALSRVVHLASTRNQRT